MSSPLKYDWSAYEKGAGLDEAVAGYARARWHYHFAYSYNYYASLDIPYYMINGLRTTTDKNEFDKHHDQMASLYYGFQRFICLMYDPKIEKPAKTLISLVVKSHRSFRRLCFKNGIKINYLEYDPELFLRKCAKDETSWFHLFAKLFKNKRPTLLTKTYSIKYDLDLFVWMMNRPGHFTRVNNWYLIDIHCNIRDLAVLEIPFIVAPSTIILDLPIDLLYIYSEVMYDLTAYGI